MSRRPDELAPAEQAPGTLVTLDGERISAQSREALARVRARAA